MGLGPQRAEKLQAALVMPFLQWIRGQFAEGLLDPGKCGMKFASPGEAEAEPIEGTGHLLRPLPDE